MRFKRRLAVLAASAAALVGGVASVGLTAGSAQAATTPTSVALPLSTYSGMVLDPTHQHIFISSAGSNTILVTDYSGNTVATIANEPGAYGLVLSSDGSTVYAALSTGDAISAISTDTLAETARYATGTGTDPTYVAYTSGKVWFGYGTYGQPFQNGIGSIDPSTSPATVNLSATNESLAIWYAAPKLAASPNGELVAGETMVSGGINMASFDTSSGGVATAVSYGSFDGGGVESMQITPDGKDVVVASGAPYYHQIFQVSNLSAVGKYPTAAYPDSVSITGDGTVAAGIYNTGSEIYMFAPGAGSPLNTYTFGSYSSPEYLADDGVAVTPDGGELFAVTSTAPTPSSTKPPLAPNPTLNIIANPAQGSSTLSVTGPATDNKDQPITLTGTLGGTSPYVGGQTLHVTRIDPTNPSGVALPDVTTAANGSFTITDTPPKAKVDSATVTYKVSYAGDAYLTGSSASASVTVRYNNS